MNSAAMLIYKFFLQQYKNKKKQKQTAIACVSSNTYFSWNKKGFSL